MRTRLSLARPLLAILSVDDTFEPNVWCITAFHGLVSDPSVLVCWALLIPYSLILPAHTKNTSGRSLMAE